LFVFVLTQVQLGDAEVLPCMDTAHDRIRAIMEDVYMSETKLHRQQQKRKAAKQRSQQLSRMGSRESISDYSESIDDAWLGDGQSVSNLSDEAESRQSASSEYSIGSMQDYGVCVDRALVIHFHSPYVPSIDIVDFPGLLPVFAHRDMLRWSGSGGSSDPLKEKDNEYFTEETDSSAEEELQWEIWRQNRLGLVEMHALANPRSMYVAAMEANAERLADSPALAVVERLNLQVSNLILIVIIDRNAIMYLLLLLLLLLLL
jgi:hypothetical protein